MKVLRVWKTYRVVWIFNYFGWYDKRKKNMKKLRTFDIIVYVKKVIWTSRISLSINVECVFLIFIKSYSSGRFDQNGCQSPKRSFTEKRIVMWLLKIFLWNKYHANSFIRYNLHLFHENVQKNNIVVDYIGIDRAEMGSRGFIWDYIGFIKWLWKLKFKIKFTLHWPKWRNND